jgi:Sigma-70 region 2
LQPVLFKADLPTAAISCDWSSAWVRMKPPGANSAFAWWPTGDVLRRNGEQPSNNDGATRHRREWRVPEPTDEELVAAMRADPSAFTLLYQRYVDRVIAVGLRRLGDPDQVADLVADVFLAVIESADRFIIDASVPDAHFNLTIGAKPGPGQSWNREWAAEAADCARRTGKTTR